MVATVNEAVMLAALGIVSACVAGLIWVIKRMFNDVVPALKHLTKATESNTEATKSADAYLQQRNGRDIERHAKDIEIQNTMVAEMKKIPDIIYSTQQQRKKESDAVLKATQAIPRTLKKIASDQAVAIIKAVSVKEQHVEHQEVQHIHVNKSSKAALETS